MPKKPSGNVQPRASNGSSEADGKTAKTRKSDAANAKLVGAKLSSGSDAPVPEGVAGLIFIDAEVDYERRNSLDTETREAIDREVSILGADILKRLPSGKEAPANEKKTSESSMETGQPNKGKRRLVWKDQKTGNPSDLTQEMKVPVLDLTDKKECCLIQ